MIKEEFMPYRTFKELYINHISISDLWNGLTAHFKDKVIIQRGENRHPYADVLHEWVEDTKKELQYDASTDGRGGMWEQSSLMRANHRIKIRIKPKEHIYEYQWLEVNDGCAEVTDFYTEAEAGHRCSAAWKKIEETKRERKTN